MSIDPKAVMAAHGGLNWCTACSHEELCDSELVPWPCEPYRLAEALAAEPDRTRAAVVKALRTYGAEHHAITATWRADAIENGAGY